MLTGPNFAHEIAAGLPAAAVVAAADAGLREAVAAALGTPSFRLYGNDDPIGAQVGGAAKNVIAIAAGAVIGAGLGENARAALITRGLAELARLAVALGGRAETVMGLSGLGDLLLTCTGPASRNYSLGLALGRGEKLADVLAARSAVTEGVATAPALVARAGGCRSADLRRGRRCWPAHDLGRGDARGCWTPTRGVDGRGSRTRPPRCDTNRMLRGILTVGGWTMASRVLGFARDMLIAAMLGAGPIADAFFVALKLPNLFRRLFGEGAFNAAFVPAFSGLLAAEGRPRRDRFAEETFAVMAFWLGVLTIAGEIFMPQMMAVLAPGFAAIPAKFALAVELSRITFPYLLLICLAALVSGVLNGLDRFTAASASYVLFNVVSIACMLWLTPYVPTAGHALSWGVTASGVVQLGLLLWALAARRHGAVAAAPAPDAAMRVLLRRMLPGLVGAGVTQLNLAVDVIIASLLPAGTVSLLYYADRVQQLPLGVIGTAVGTALLPLLSRQVRAGEAEAARGHAEPRDRIRAVPDAAGRAGADRQRVSGDVGAVRPRRVRRRERAAVGAVAGRLCAGAAGVRAGEGAGAGVLRARRHRDAGEDRGRRGGAEPGDERRLHGAAAAYRPGAGDQPGGDLQRGLAGRGADAARPSAAGRAVAAARRADGGGDAGDGRGAVAGAARAVRRRSRMAWRGWRRWRRWSAWDWWRYGAAAVVFGAADWRALARTIGRSTARRA